MSTSPCAALRPLQVARFSGVSEDPAVGASSRVALRDPLGLIGEPALGGSADASSSERTALLLSDAEWRIAQAFDGERTSADVARELSVEAATVDALAERLSRALALADARFEAAADEALAASQQAPERPPYGPGRDYPLDRTELRIRVGGLLANDWDMPPAPRLHGLWAPACHFEAAGPLYSRCYGAVRHHADFLDRIVLLGALGAPVRSLLVPLDRPLGTSLGTLAFDAAALAALAILPGRDALAHRTALALERHALFLRLAAPRVPVLPILVGALPSASTDATPDPRTYPPLEHAFAALQRVMALPGKTLVIAAADLTHWMTSPGASATPSDPNAPVVRPKGTFLFTGRLASEVRAAERECAQAAEELDPDRFWRAGFRGAESSRRNNLTAPYLLLRLMQAAHQAETDSERRGSLLGYLPVQSKEAFTTAATMVFHG